MKLSGLILLVKASIKKNKVKNILFAILLVIAVFFTTLTVSVAIPLWNNVENKINNHIYNRSPAMFFDGDKYSTEEQINDKLAEIKALPHVVSVYKNQKPVEAMEKNGVIESQITLNYLLKDASPLITKGRALDENDTNKALIPKTIREYSESKHKIQEIDGEALVGTTLKFMTGSVEYEAEVVGTYSLSDPMFTGKQIIIPYNDLEKLNADSGMNIDSEEKDLYVVETDYYKNTQSVKDSIESDPQMLVLDYFKLNLDVNTFQAASIVLMAMAALFIVMIFITVLAFVNNHIKTRTVEMALYRALGYRSGHIFMIMLAEYIAIGLFSIIIGLLISAALSQFVVNPYLYGLLGGTIMEMKADITVLTIAIITVVMILIELFSCIIATKRTSVIKLVVLLKEK